MNARLFWQMNPGRNVVNVNWNAISADSVVLVSASEYTSNSQQLPDKSDQRFVGAADVRVANVTPHGPPFDSNQGVTFVVELDWNAPLTICTDIAVVANSPDAVVYVGPQIESRQMASSPNGIMHRTLEARSIPHHGLSATVESAPRAESRNSTNRQSVGNMGAAITRHHARVVDGSAF